MNKQSFSKLEFDKFRNYFNIKENPSEIEKKFVNKTIKYLNYIKWIPGIKMIGIGNSISMNCADRNSDIDLFVVTSQNRIWFARIFITFIFQILSVRKNEKYHAGRFCLSFFSTTSGMDFSNFAIEKDIYLYFWIIYFKPILDFDNTYEKFLETNNWVDLSGYKGILNKNKSFIKYVGKSFGNNSKILDFLEKIIKSIFLKKTLKTYEKLGKPFGVIINDNLLKFHNADIREKLKEELNI